jgi:ATP synthase protein I
MVPFHNPIPDDKRRSKDSSAGRGKMPPQRRGPVAGGPGMMTSWIQAEKMIQIALVLPCAALIGWLAGAWIGNRMHQPWIAIAGVVFGGAAGLIYAVRTALAANKDPALQDKNDDQDGQGSAGSQP